jgi:arylsulfatase
METRFGLVPDNEAWRLGLNFCLNCTRDVDRSMDLVLDALAATRGYTDLETQTPA